MNRIFSIAANTFREAIRNRVLYVVLAFAVLFSFGSRFLGSISVGQDVRIIKDLGLAGISLFSVLIGILIGTSIVYQEIDRRTIYTVLSKPVRRFEFVIGKYLGLCAVLTVVVLGMSVLFLAQVALSGGELTGSLAVALGLSLFELFVIMSVAVLLSCIASPLLSAVFSFCFFVIGHTIRNLLALLGYIESAFVRKALSLLYFVLPNLDNFNVHSEVVNGQPLPWEMIGYSLAYGAVYIVAMLTLATWALGRREL